MMDCKKALTEADGDIDKAIEFLREKGLAAAARRRPAASPPRVWLCHRLRRRGRCRRGQRRDRLRRQERQVSRLRQGRGRCRRRGEPRRSRGPDGLQDGNGRRHRGRGAEGDGPRHRREHQGPPLCPLRGHTSTPYIHGGGKIGVLVNFERSTAGIEVAEFGKDIAMQIAAANPRYWDKSPTSRGRSGQGEGDRAGSDGQRSQDGQQARRRSRRRSSWASSASSSRRTACSSRRSSRTTCSPARSSQPDSAHRLRGRRSFREGRGHREEAGELRRRDRFHDQGLRLPRANNTEAGHGSVRPLLQNDEKTQVYFCRSNATKIAKILVKRREKCYNN